MKFIRFEQKFLNKINNTNFVGTIKNMTDMKEKLATISHKIDDLINRNGVLFSENQILNGKIQEFQQIINEKNSEIDQLKGRVLELEKKSTEKANFDVEDYKNKLNGLMKEIDECIAILNN